MNVDLTHGSIFRGLLRFSLPLMAGNLLQQLYNLVDTFVVGRYCGEIALAAVGSAFSVMILLTSIVTGLCMGSGVVVSQLFGQKDDAGVRKAVGNAFVLIAGVSALLTILSYALLPVMMALLRIPPEAQGVLSRYLLIVFIGIIPTFLYNFGACMLRAVGNSTAPLVFLLISSLTNVALDFLFVAVLPWGVAGAAVATLDTMIEQTAPAGDFLSVGAVLAWLMCLPDFAVRVSPAAACRSGRLQTRHGCAIVVATHKMEDRYAACYNAGSRDRF